MAVCKHICNKCGSVRTKKKNKEIGFEWRRFEPVPGSYITEEQVKEVLERTKLSRTDLAIILCGLRVRHGIDLQALGIGPRDAQANPLTEKTHTTKANSDRCKNCKVKSRLEQENDLGYKKKIEACSISNDKYCLVRMEYEEDYRLVET